MKLSAQQILRIREELGMTQTEFAAHVGVTRFAVGAWERGKRQQTLANDLKIRDFLRDMGISMVQ